MNHKIRELRKALVGLKPYIKTHATYCKYDSSMSWNGSNPDSDICTCNYKQVVDRVEKAIKNFENVKTIKRVPKPSVFDVDFRDDSYVT